MKPEMMTGAVDGVVVRGRIQLPTELAWREPKIAVTASPKRCLILARRQTWECLEQKLLAMCGDRTNKPSPATSMLRRLMLGFAEILPVNGNRTIELPAALLHFANIDGAVRWVPSGNFLQLWNAEDYERYRRTKLKTG